MKRLAIAAAGAAVIGLTACTHASQPSAAPAAHGSSRPIVPVSCSQQYRTWNRGEGKGVMEALSAVTSATTSKNAKMLTTTLKHARPAVARAARHPIPACADPRGFWDVLLMHLTAAASGKASVSSVHAALQDVRKIHQELLAEVSQYA